MNISAFARKHDRHQDFLDRKILMMGSRTYAEGGMNYDSRGLNRRGSKAMDLGHK